MDKKSDDDVRDLKPNDFESELAYLQDKMMVWDVPALTKTISLIILYLQSKKFKRELILEITDKSEIFKSEIEDMLNKNKHRFTNTDKSLTATKK